MLKLLLLSCFVLCSPLHANDKMELALVQLKEQNQEMAFKLFLESLEKADIQPMPTPIPQEETLYTKALAVYFDHTDVRAAKEMANKIIDEFAPQLKEHPQAHLTAYIVALAYANTNRYSEFFPLFFNAYRYYPHHFLAYKTKGILHIKLMERAHDDGERCSQRQKAIDNFALALSKEPKDVSLYKLLITFSSPQQKQDQVRQCLNKIIAGNIIIPRGDVQFYVQQAMGVQEKILAQQFVNKAREWYPNSRILAIAQQYIDSN